MGLTDDARQGCLIMRSAGRRDAGRFGIIGSITLLYSTLSAH